MKATATVLGGLVLVLVGATVALAALTHQLTISTVVDGTPLPLGLRRGGCHRRPPPAAQPAVVASSLLVLAPALFPLMILLFPDGRITARRWRWALWVYAVLVGYVTVTTAGQMVTAFAARLKDTVVTVPGSQSGLGHVADCTSLSLIVQSCTQLPLSRRRPEFADLGGAWEASSVLARAEFRLSNVSPGILTYLPSINCLTFAMTAAGLVIHRRDTVTSTSQDKVLNTVILDPRNIPLDHLAQLGASPLAHSIQLFQDRLEKDSIPLSAFNARILDVSRS
ncbi:MAG TPA: hypothetical protein VHZ03_25185 [Trebonia sp.]|nr:hypothetical protein [Trebonia sp.]